MRKPGGKKVEIDAIFEEDASAALEALGVLTPLVSGDLNCSVCGQCLDRDSLGAVRQGSNGKLELVCRRLDCVRVLGGGAS